MNTKKKKYIAPKMTISKVELEQSIAASSTTVTPGGGGSNSQPWITEEDAETIEKDWVF